MVLKKLHFNFIFSFLTIFLFGFNQTCFGAATAAEGSMSGSRKIFLISRPPIGEGGKAYICEAILDGASVAIKFLHAPEEGEDVEQLQKEANLLEIANKISPENTCKFIGTTFDSLGHLCLIMKKYDCDFLTYVTDVQILPRRLRNSFLLCVIIDVLKALSALHKKGFVHRDIKPENIFIDGTRGVLGDFGLMEQMVEGKQYPILGTPCYMAPESLKKEVSPKNDVWSWGCVVGYAFSLRVPYDDIFSDDETEMTLNIVKTILQGIQPSFIFSSETPTIISELLTICLRTNPSERASAEIALKKALGFVSKFTL